jgi:hypothetical protein
MTLEQFFRKDKQTGASKCSTAQSAIILKIEELTLLSL